VAAWEALKVQWEKTKITAPIEGMVTEKTVEAGETISTGSRWQ
jgi:multidrug resistance efflux pump